jgi:hypothetical protein
MRGECCHEIFSFVDGACMRSDTRGRPDSSAHRICRNSWRVGIDGLSHGNKVVVEHGAHRSTRDDACRDVRARRAGAKGRRNPRSTLSLVLWHEGNIAYGWRRVLLQCNPNRLLQRADGMSGPASGSHDGLGEIRVPCLNADAVAVAGPPKGNQNAYKHGRYTAQAITRRREVRALLKSIKQLVEVA